MVRQTKRAKPAAPRGGAVLGRGTFGEVHTLPDLLDLQGGEAGDDAQVMVTFVITSPDNPPRVMHQIVPTRLFVAAFRKRLVYKLALPQEYSDAPEAARAPEAVRLNARQNVQQNVQQNVRQRVQGGVQWAPRGQAARGGGVQDGVEDDGGPLAQAQRLRDFMTAPADAVLRDEEALGMERMVVALSMRGIDVPNIDNVAPLLVMRGPYPAPPSRRAATTVATSAATSAATRASRRPGVSTTGLLLGERPGGLARGESLTVVSARVSPAVEVTLYKFMDGDLATCADPAKNPRGMRLSDVLDICSAVLRTLLVLRRGGGHHCDIKPQNMLYRYATPRSRHAKFVVSDFGSVAWSPRRVVWHRSTPGYVSPLFYDEFSSFERHYSAYTLKLVHWPRRVLEDGHGSPPDARAVWDSFAAERLRLRAATRQAGASAEAAMTTDTAVSRAFVKNDLYALGVMLLCFDYPAADADTNASLDPAAVSRAAAAAEVVQHGAMRLITGRPPGVWTLSSAHTMLVQMTAFARRAGALESPAVMTTRRRAS
jgi:serine/threonine protein kinase